MAATKRKRRGGLAVQAKRPKRSEKDAKPPAKQRDKAEEAEEEDRNRIPGPVCKVDGLLPAAPAAAASCAFPGVTCLLTALRLSGLLGCYRSPGSALGRTARRVYSEPPCPGLPPGGAAEQLRGRSSYLAHGKPTRGVLGSSVLARTPLHVISSS